MSRQIETGPIKGVRLIIFDWSGTISDDRHAFHQSTMEVAKNHGKENISFTDWLSRVKLTVKEMYQVLGFDQEEINEELLAEHVESFKKKTSDLPEGEEIKPWIYPEVKETLEKLKQQGFTLMVVSTHPQEFLEKEAEEYGVDKFFSKMLGGIEEKTESIKKACEEAGVEMSEAVYVGDTVSDRRAAREAGIKMVAITGGWDSEAELRKEKPDRLIHWLDELVDLLKD